jgi:hypothetical protein
MLGEIKQLVQLIDMLPIDPKASKLLFTTTLTSPS